MSISIPKQPNTNKNILGLQSRNEAYHEEPELKKLSAEFVCPDFFDNLPEPLKDICAILQSQTEKEVFLTSALSVLSGIMPNVYGRYNGGVVEPNLYAYIVGGFGSGKSIIVLAKKMLDQCQEWIESISVDYAPQKKDDKPPVPNTLIIPADNTKSGFMQLLSHNKNRGIIVDTEGVCLTSANKNTHGGFSDMLCKGFTGEAWECYRSGDRSYTRISRLILSIVLTNTPRQFREFVGDGENGLFSRFCLIELPTSWEFENVFNIKKREYNGSIEAAGNYVLNIFKYLSSYHEPAHEFKLLPQQENIFLSFFQEQKKEVFRYLSPDAVGLANRWGLMCYKIAMCLTVLRTWQNKEWQNTIYCSDNDFDIAMKLTNLYVSYIKKMYIECQGKTKIPNETEVQPIEKTIKERQREVAKEMHNNKKTIREIAKTMNIPVSSAYYLIFGRKQ